MGFVVQNGKKVWQPDQNFNPNEKVEVPKLQYSNNNAQQQQVQGVINQQNRTDEQKNSDIINNAHGVQSQNVRNIVENSMSNPNPVQQAGEPAPVEKTPEQLKHEERMKDADYAKMYAMDPDSADNYASSVEKENLAEQMALLHREDPEEKEKRIKKEERNRKLTAAFNMLGALGNFGVASFAKDGRSVPVGNAIEAVDKAQTESQKRRDANIAKLQQLERRQSELMQQGYTNAANRKRQRELDEANRAHQKAQEELAKAKADEAKRQFDLKFGLDSDKADRDYALKQAAEARQSRMTASNIAKNNSQIALNNEKVKTETVKQANGGGIGGKKDAPIPIPVGDGSQQILLPKAVMEGPGLAKIYNELPEDVRKKVDAYIEEKKKASSSKINRGNKTETAEEKAAREYEEKQHMAYAIGVWLDKEGCENAYNMAVNLQNATQATETKKKASPTGGGAKPSGGKKSPTAN